eukprot:Gb_02712 [translate_table: standard]
MHKCSFGVHEIKLVVDSGEHFGHTGGVGNHANSSLNFGQIAPGNDGGRLIVYSTLEPRWAPIHKLNGSLCFDRCHRRIHILWHDISTVHEAARHVFPMARIALSHHGGRLKGAVCNFCNRQLLVVSFLCRDHRRVRRKHKMDSRIRNQVCLELRYIHV